ncbi:MAG: NAD(P)-binding domain-containing protein [Deltaproteobacteria bacterium]|jgi:putative flavoprotein involved in K+ transport|nr:NAD(P)-binding domain-containing protein [Deltaproteobacteria bacterium]
MPLADDRTAKLERPRPPPPRFEPLVIVGAGFAGLSAASAARERDLDPLVLDAGSEVGGAWNHMPPSMVCLSPRIRDRLPDGSYPGGLRERATAAHVLDAIQAYAERARFRCELGVRVMAAERDGGTMRLRTTTGEITAGKLVVATGEYGAPRIPRTLPIGFEGPILHSSEFRAAELMPGERVVVIGAGNSGAEVAVSALEHGARVTVCASEPLAPPPWEPRGPLARAMAWLASGVPVGGLPGRLGCSARVPSANPAFWDAARHGRVRVAGRALAIESRVVRLASGEVCAADRVVLATGFRRDLEFLGGAVRLDGDGLPLHRGGLSSDLPSVAYLGLPCLRTRRSGFLRGFTADARAVVGALLRI